MAKSGRDTEKDIMTGGGKSRIGVIVLVFLCMIIVVLGGVITVRLLTDGTTTGDSSKDADDSESSKVNEMLDSFSEQYYDGKHEEALANYQKQMDEAIEAKDYDKYLNVFSSREMTLLYDDSCEDLMKTYDYLRADELPVDIRLNVYGTAAISSEECGDTEKQTYFEQKIQQLYDSGEAELDEDE